MKRDKLFAEYEELYLELQPKLARLNQLKAELGKSVNKRRAEVEYGMVTVSYRAGYTRPKWDTRALEGYSAAHPDILQFKSEIVVKPGAAIKVVVPEGYGEDL